MSALAFLGLDADGALAHSPMERLARDAGARFEARAGWNVAVAYGEDAELERTRIERTVGFCDRSWLTKLELHGAHEVPLGTAERRDGAWWCPVTPDRLLVLGSGVTVPAGADAVDFTSGLAAMTLAGPDAHELLARFCAIDVRDAATPVGGFRPGSVARTPGYLLREGEHRLLLLVGWALGQYLWEVVADAAEHLGGGPVGAEALDA
jgi:glycine cleavage system aminomethyltransferase T